MDVIILLWIWKTEAIGNLEAEVKWEEPIQSELLAGGCLNALQSLFAQFTLLLSPIFYPSLFPQAFFPSLPIPIPHLIAPLSPKTFNQRGASSLITANSLLSRAHANNGTPSLDPLSTSPTFSPFYSFYCHFSGCCHCCSLPMSSSCFWWNPIRISGS